jgi:hypothetical protein
MEFNCGTILWLFYTDLIPVNSFLDGYAENLVSFLLLAVLCLALEGLLVVFFTYWILENMELIGRIGVTGFF